MNFVTRRSLVITLCSIAGCASTPQAEAPAASVARETIVGPAETSLASGATVTIPKGLRAIRGANEVRLLDPDDAVEIALFEYEQEDLAAAIAAAWKQVDPGFAQKIEKTLTPPSSDGWDAVNITNYVDTEDGGVAYAIARRKASRSYVAVVRGLPSDLDKRAAQMRSFIGSLQVAGVDEIDLSKVEPKPIADSIPELEAFIEKTMKATNTPGLQIAIVEGDGVVFSRGFGVREVGKGELVDADTLMMIGSVSKSMTTMMMATLVDEKKFAWADPVTSVYPKFRLGDPELAKALLVEQLVCACTGLPRKDVPLILEFEGKTADDVFTELETLKPSTRLKETYQYQNHLVAAGGYVAAHALMPDVPLSQAYAAAMKARVFAPLGFERTTLDHDRAIADPNHATPHSTDLSAQHRVVDIEHERFASFVAPSGAIWSSANEMARYIMTELQRGVAPSGTRVVSETNLTHRWVPQVAISDGLHYGLGYMIENRRELRTIRHGGGTMGFATKVAFIPEKKIGYVMISNGTGGHLVQRAVEARLRELWFGVDEKSEASFEHSLKTQAEYLGDLEKRTRIPDETWMKPFLGHHHNDEVGKIVITRQGAEYLLDAGVYRTRLLQHDGQDGKRTLLFSDPPLAGLVLTPGDDGTLAITRAQEHYAFERR